MGFARSLASGNKAEKTVQEVFAKHGFASRLNPDRKKFSEFDVEADMPFGKIKLECKFDLFCALSGNIAIEFFNPKQGKPSGVNVTKADIWVHMITKPMSVWFTGVDMLKHYVQIESPHKLISCGGDSNSSMYIYKKDVIFDAIFTRVDEFYTDDFVYLIDKLMKRG